MSEYDAAEIAYKNGLDAGKPKWNAVDSEQDNPKEHGKYLCVMLVPVGCGLFKKTQEMVEYTENGWKLPWFNKSIVIGWMNPIEYPKIAVN